MKKELICSMFLLSVLFVSFVSAATYSSSTTVAFNSVSLKEDSNKNLEETMFWKNVIGVVSTLLVALAFVMIYKLKKKQAKQKASAKKRKVAKKKKVVKKVRSKRKVRIFI